MCPLGSEAWHCNCLHHDGRWINAAIAGVFVVDQYMAADTIAAHIDPQTGQLYQDTTAVCVPCPANSTSPALSTDASACTCIAGWSNKNDGVSDSVTVCILD